MIRSHLYDFQLQESFSSDKNSNKDIKPNYFISQPRSLSPPIKHHLNVIEHEFQTLKSGNKNLYKLKKKEEIRPLVWKHPKNFTIEDNSEFQTKETKVKEQMNSRLEKTISEISSATTSHTNLISKFVQSVENFDCRQTGIGVDGGHISRELKLPGALGGNPCWRIIDNSFKNFLGHVPNLQEFDRPRPYPVRHDENWNVRFHLNRPLSAPDPNVVEFSRRSKNKDRFVILREDMRLFSRSLESLHESNSPLPSAQSTRISQQRQLQKLASSPNFLNMFSHPFTDDELSALEFWKNKKAELRSIARLLTPQDLVQLSALTTPPDEVVKEIGYLCVLLGLQPTWSAAKKALLRLMSPLLNFISEVDPLRVPLRRLFHLQQYQLSFPSDVSRPPGPANPSDEETNPDTSLDPSPQFKLPSRLQPTLEPSGTDFESRPITAEQTSKKRGKPVVISATNTVKKLRRWISVFHEMVRLVLAVSQRLISNPAKTHPTSPRHTLQKTLYETTSPSLISTQTVQSLSLTPQTSHQEHRNGLSDTVLEALTETFSSQSTQSRPTRLSLMQRRRTISPALMKAMKETEELKLSNIAKLRSITSSPSTSRNTMRLTLSLPSLTDNEHATNHTSTPPPFSPPTLVLPSSLQVTEEDEDEDDDEDSVDSLPKKSEPAQTTQPAHQIQKPTHLASTSLIQSTNSNKDQSDPPPKAPDPVSSSLLTSTTPLRLTSLNNPEVAEWNLVSDRPHPLADFYDFKRDPPSLEGLIQKKEDIRKFFKLLSQELGLSLHEGHQHKYHIGGKVFTRKKHNINDSALQTNPSKFGFLKGTGRDDDDDLSFLPANVGGKGFAISYLHTLVRGDQCALSPSPSPLSRQLSLTPSSSTSSLPTSPDSIRPSLSRGNTRISSLTDGGLSSKSKKHSSFSTLSFPSTQSSSLFSHPQINLLSLEQPTLHPSPRICPPAVVQRTPPFFRLRDLILQYHLHILSPPHDDLAHNHHHHSPDPDYHSSSLSKSPKTESERLSELFSLFLKDFHQQTSTSLVPSPFTQSDMGPDSR